MNYFGKHIPEAITRTFTGRTSRGKLLRPIDRMNWLKGTAIIMGTLWGLRKAFNLSYEKYLLPWGIALNTNFLSPVGQVIMGAWKRVTAKSDWVKRQAEWQIKNASRIFIPYYLAVKDVLDWMNGERSLKETLFYTEGRYDKEEEKPKANVRERLPESYSGTKKSSVSIRDRVPESYQNLGKSGGVSIKEQLPESYR
jgi:hypothetical protein